MAYEEEHQIGNRAAASAKETYTSAVAYEEEHQIGNRAAASAKATYNSAVAYEEEHQIGNRAAVSAKATYTSAVAYEEEHQIGNRAAVSAEATYNSAVAYEEEHQIGNRGIAEASKWTGTASSALRSQTSEAREEKHQIESRAAASASSGGSRVRGVSLVPPIGGQAAFLPPPPPVSSSTPLFMSPAPASVVFSSSKGNGTHAELDALRARLAALEATLGDGGDGSGGGEEMEGRGGGGGGGLSIESDQQPGTPQPIRSSDSSGAGHPLDSGKHRSATPSVSNGGDAKAGGVTTPARSPVHARVPAPVDTRTQAPTLRQGPVPTAAKRWAPVQTGSAKTVPAVIAPAQTIQTVSSWAAPRQKPIQLSGTNTASTTDPLPSWVKAPPEAPSLNADSASSASIADSVRRC